MSERGDAYERAEAMERGAAERERLQAERDELLAALESVNRQLNELGYVHGVSDLLLARLKG